MVLIGMSTPDSEWDSRLQQVGGKVGARRLFGQLSNTSGLVKTAAAEVAAGRWPVLSFKVANNDWAGVAAGKYDKQLDSLAQSLGALNGRVFVTLHHEPQGDGTPADYAKMLTHALPRLAVNRFVRVGPIVNGFWWSNKGQGLTDAEIAQWLPQPVLDVSHIVAADCYQGGTAAKPGEGAGPKMRNLSAWADRVGVTRLGVGEYNGLNAASLNEATDALLADPVRYRFACCFNSSVNNRAGVDWTLTGDRLTAFKQSLTKTKTVLT